MKRESMILNLQEDIHWDVLIIGGGASGLGAAVDAASRGYKTLLIEQNDFAKGTSSRSTKLIHGGLRYLKQGNLSLVREALHERERLFQNAPHLVHHLAFVIAAYKWWEKPYYGIGLKLYDLLAGSLNRERSKNLSLQDTIKLLPTVKKKSLSGGLLYYDGQFDDARLAMTLALTAAELGSTIINYVRADDLIKENNRVCGIYATDNETGQKYTIRSKAIINATGVFCDKIRLLDDSQACPMITPSRGVHIVLPKHFNPSSSALMIPKTDDGRVLFLLPWYQHVLAGTTDTPVHNTPLEPYPTIQEIDFILGQINKYLDVSPTRNDILSAFAGLRPLVKSKTHTSTAAISRDHTIVISSSGLITIAGGKWTTYRKMAEDVIDQAIKVGHLATRPCITCNLHLHGWTPSSFSKHWDTTTCYGSDTKFLEELIQKDPSLGKRLHPSLPYLEAEVVWAVQNEMARSVEDILSRRTRALLLDAKAAIETAPAVAHLMAAILNKPQEWIDSQIEAFTALAKHYLIQV